MPGRFTGSEEKPLASGTRNTGLQTSAGSKDGQEEGSDNSLSGVALASVGKGREGREGRGHGAE